MRSADPSPFVADTQARDLAPHVLASVAVLALLALAGPAVAQVCSGCSCRGGPGFRLPNGSCASWRQNERFCDGACYPPGT